MDSCWNSRIEHEQRPGLRLIVLHCILCVYHIYLLAYHMFLISFLSPILALYHCHPPFWFSVGSPWPVCRISLGHIWLCILLISVHHLLSLSALSLSSLSLRMATGLDLLLCLLLYCAMSIYEPMFNEAKATTITFWSPSDKTSPPSGLQIAVFSKLMAYSWNICQVCRRFWPLSFSSSSIWGNHSFCWYHPSLLRLRLHLHIFDILSNLTHLHLKRLSSDGSPSQCIASP